MKKEITGIIIIVIFGLFLSVTNACECPIKVGDHVSPTTYYIIDEKENFVEYRWHCGDVESIYGKCGEWKILVRNCTDKKIKLYYSYVKILNSQKKNEPKQRIIFPNLSMDTDCSKNKR